ncbi:MAG: hypothetical protein HY321_14465 [Armatimonadetes bacterium]|nr:hypothetical protein [Armatimonadota bacterium]
MADTPLPHPAQRVVTGLARLADSTARALDGILTRAPGRFRERLAQAPEDPAEGIVYAARAAQRTCEEARQELSGALASALPKAVRAGAALGTPGQQPPRGFLLPDLTRQHLARYHAQVWDGITGDLRREITRRVRMAYAAGKTPEELAGEIEAYLSPVGPFRAAGGRARAVAHTELPRAANLATLARMEEIAADFPRMRKRWVHARHNARQPRPAHLAADGQTVLHAERFRVGRHRPRYPNDPGLPLSERVFCGCLVAAVEPEDARD